MSMPYTNSDVLYESDLHLPHVDEWERDAVADEILDVCDSLSEPREFADAEEFSYYEPYINALFDVVPLVESLLKVEPDCVSYFHAADLVTMCTFPSLSEAVAVQIAFGREVGVENRETWLSLITEAQKNQMSVDDDVVEFVAQTNITHDRVSRLLRGEEEQTPMRERLRRGIMLLRRVIALAPTPCRVGLLCTLAWLQWANGKRAISIAYLEEAERLEPDHVLVFAFIGHFSSRMPAWIPDR